MSGDEQTTEIVREREAFVREFQQAYYRRGIQANETGLVAAANVAADLLVTARADAWNEGHAATDTHGPGDCECPNPYRPRNTPAVTEEADRG